jgi:hypothetical protein
MPHIGILTHNSGVASTHHMLFAAIGTMYPDVDSNWLAVAVRSIGCARAGYGVGGEVVECAGDDGWRRVCVTDWNAGLHALQYDG